MQLAPILPLLALFTACAGVKEQLPAEESPQQQWERVYAAGSPGTQPAASSTQPNSPSDSPHPGYVLDPGTNLHVWTPGTTHTLRPHQTAGQSEGTWMPDPGYAPSPPGSTQVEWQTGLRHPAREHVVAGTRAGQWVAERGYVLDDEGRARWAPGRPDPGDSSLESGVGEGTWVERPQGERGESPSTPLGEADESPEATPPQETERSWAAVVVPLETAARLQRQIDEERRIRGVQRAGVLTELTEQLDTAIDTAVAAGFPAESPMARTEVRAVALSGLESSFAGWAALGKDHSTAASKAVRSRCPAVVDVDGAAEFFVRLRQAADRLKAGAPGTVE